MASSRDRVAATPSTWPSERWFRDGVRSTQVAAASIGQVYKARLRNGKVVALKVQRPDCERVVALDLFVLRWWARLGTSFFVRARTRRGNSKVTRSS